MKRGYLDVGRHGQQLPVPPMVTRARFEGVCREFLADTIVVVLHIKYPLDPTAWACEDIAVGIRCPADKALQSRNVFRWRAGHDLSQGKSHKGNN